MSVPDRTVSEPFDGTWERPSLVARRELRYGLYLVAGLYLVMSFWLLEFSLDRMVQGFDNLQTFTAGILQPATSNIDPVIDGMIVSLQMAFLGTAAGVLLAIPFAFLAAENLVPRPVYLLTRGFVGSLRAFHSLVLAIVFVKLFGLGAFAGTMALVVSSVGFVGKLLAEEIEEIRVGELEAIRATGASWPIVWLYAVYPQVFPRLVGLAIYRADINIRASTILGIVGAGGIGSVLISAMDTYQFDIVSTALLAIILVVLIGEYVSTFLRARVV